MHITAVKATGYRNLSGTITIPAPLALLVGENNVGKSNAIDALRLVLEPENPNRGRFWARTDDFTHDGTGSRMGDELEIEVRIEGLEPSEQARMVTCLAPNEGPGIAKLRMRAKVGRDGRVRSDWLGGDSQQADVERYAKEAIRFVYLHPLRDAAADLRPGRDNRLVPLLKAMIPEDHADYSEVIKAMTDANSAIGNVGRVNDARARIHDRLQTMTGGAKYAQKSTLAFEDPDFDRIVGQLRAKIGELGPLEMRENGLGFNNILYMAVLLAAMSEQPRGEGEEPLLRVLLVEEPEAHLHPQLQDLLMRFLESQVDKANQVIVTSHSPNFASAARIERLSVVTGSTAGSDLVSRTPGDFGLQDKHLAFLHRFLDVTKAALFFAKGVILVEGVAEQLLVPIFARLIRRELPPAGVTVININGVAFDPFAELFGEDRLPFHLAAVSDGDPAIDPDDPDGDLEPCARAKRLKAREGGNVRVHLSERTLEWDLALVEGNRPIMLEALKELKPQVGANIEGELKDLSERAAADKLFVAIEDCKGEYAQVLAELLADGEQAFTVPQYLRDAIEWATDGPGASDSGEPDQPADATPVADGGSES